MAKVCSGYPRFVRHPLIEAFAKIFLGTIELDPGEYQPFFFGAPHAKKDALAKLGTLSKRVVSHVFRGVSVLVALKGSEAEKQLAKYIQHTGTGLSSREAEDLMVALEPQRRRFPEYKTLFDGHESFRHLLHKWFSPKATSVVLPCKSGMNAFFAAFQTINRIQVPKGRKNWISIGWLYLDTMHILDIYLPEGGTTKTFPNANQTEAILNYIEEKGDQVAGLVLEAPTNPLVQTPDILRISEACSKAGILTVMDPSLVSPQNVDLSPHCDIICCSLTKYAAYDGDIMIGAVSVNLEKEHGELLKRQISKELTLPFSRDLARLGGSLEDARTVLDSINANTMKMASFFENHAGVSKLHWAYASGFSQAYEQIQRGPNRPGGVLTLELTKPIAEVYDALPLPKGPSFGTKFTLVCPYIHLAHYDLLQSEEGRLRMKQAGIHANMIRLSIGTENPDDLMEIFDRHL